ncbi:MAG: O-antigen ligase family protein [Crocosphaera sp.]
MPFLNKEQYQYLKSSFISNYLLDLDVFYLSASMIIFPFSVSIAVVLFWGFIIRSMLKFNLCSNKNTRKKNIFYIFFVALLIPFVVEIFANRGSELIYPQYRNPVSIHDYLMVIITIVALKFNRLSLVQVKRVLSVLSLSPIIVFLVDFQDFSLNSRISMGFRNPNWLGLYVSICIPIILCYGLHELFKTRGHFLTGFSLILLSLSLVFAFLMLFGSGSRAALLATIVNLILIIYISTRNIEVTSIKNLKARLNTSIIVSIALACTVSLILILSQQQFAIFKRFLIVWGESNQFRAKIFQCYFSLGSEKMLTGWWPANTGKICRERIGRIADGAHNFILQMFSDYGIIITMITLALIAYYILIPAGKYLFTKHQDTEANLYILCSIMLSYLSIMIITLFGFGFYIYPLFPLWLGFLWGCQSNLLSEI